MINSPNKIVALLAILILLPLTAGVCLADTDAGSQSSTTYKFGGIFSGVKNICHWNSSVSYSPNPAVSDEMDITVGVSIGEVDFTIIDFSYPTQTFTFYAYPNSSNTVITITMTGITQNKPWTFMRGSHHLYDGNLFSNNTGGISFTFTSGSENSSYELSQYGAGTGSPSGPGGNPPSYHTTTATTTSANTTAAGIGNEGWTPPTNGIGTGIEGITPMIIVGVLIGFILIITGTSSSGGIRGIGYIISLVLGSIILLLIYSNATLHNIIQEYLPQIISVFIFIIIIMLVTWLFLASSKPRRRRDPEDETGM